jgi:hypothetical protein
LIYDARDYAGLVALTPEKFLNRFLKDYLTDPWDDENDNGMPKITWAALP